MNPPPFLVSFSSAEEFLKALSDKVLSSYVNDINDLCKKQLPPVVSIRCLATLFGYSAKFTGALYKRSERYYRTFNIPKGKKRRTINAPRVALKVIQKWFGFHLAEALQFDNAVYGFVKGRSAVDAAATHCEADWIYSIDIENFFPSTKQNLVKQALMDIEYPEHGADIIAKLCCYNGGLAQGSPASPVLSNLVFRNVDVELAKIVEARESCYSRYADDIVISGIGEFPKEIRSIIKSTIESRGWKISIAKVRLAKRPNRLKVHGLLVNGKKPRLTKGYRNRIRAFRHLLSKKAICEKDLLRIMGHISYANSVEKKGQPF